MYAGYGWDHALAWVSGRVLLLRGCHAPHTQLHAEKLSKELKRMCLRPSSSSPQTPDDRELLEPKLMMNSFSSFLKQESCYVVETGLKLTL